MKTLLAASAFALVGGAALAQMANPMVGGAEMPATNDIVTNALNSADHTTLVAAVQAAGLVETLQGAGPFTVLAPTNEAFAALPAGTVESLLEPQNKDRLTQILTCHVIAAEAFSTDIVGMIEADGGTHPIETVGGCVLQATTQNGMVMITDEQGRTATVTIADVDQSNGVIHVIDTVLLPSADAQQ
ncbi:fasciclin domain-containing protein [Rubellimicrobium rubrum]|uniref:Fasciclin domain-containing protein n=1 Tax=Rubellimicrobium rubrum TaxID=2585369 RepID=A0A5C4MZR1_9RHOB|nr:fasciclin domain-containing protein [Rubellimicrobium rubrum]TNC50091.1 fasciclin domain-containing protein [Rubellimicrobium rubrum]